MTPRSTDPADSTRLLLPIRPTDHIIGPENAKYTLVEYGDYECPNCGRLYLVISDLQKDFADRLRVVYRHYPLSGIHPHAQQAAEAAEAAAAQGKFWEMYDLLFENQTHLNQTHLKAQHLHSYAERLGLDLSRYTAEMDDEIYLQRVREHMESARQSGVRATPTFFVNGRLQDVSFGLRALFDAVEEALKHHRRS